MGRIFCFYLAVAIVSGASLRSEAAVTPAPATKATAISRIEVDQALKSLKQRSPERYSRIMKLRDSEPELFSQNILQVSQEQERLQRLKALIPENYQLQVSMWNNRDKLSRFVEEYRSEPDQAGRKIIESQIDNLLGEQFAIRSQMRVNRWKRAERRLAEMKQEMRQEPMSAQKSKFIAEWKPKLLAKARKTAQ